jgi:hypothetical protein
MLCGQPPRHRRSSIYCGVYLRHVPTPLALNVDNVDEAVAFYSKLFAPSQPSAARLRQLRHRRAAAQSSCCWRTPAGRLLNHLGVEVADVGHRGRRADPPPSRAWRRSTNAAPLCYANQVKFWVEGAPNGERWEIYTVLADSLTFSAESATGAACCGTEDSAEAEPAPTAAACC